MLEQEIGCVNAQGCTDQLRSLEKQKRLSGRENSNYEHGCGLKYIMMKIHVSQVEISSGGKFDSLFLCSMEQHYANFYASSYRLCTCRFHNHSIMCTAQIYLYCIQTMGSLGVTEVDIYTVTHLLCMKSQTCCICLCDSKQNQFVCCFSS